MLQSSVTVDGRAWLEARRPTGSCCRDVQRGVEAQVGAMVMEQEKRGQALELSTSRMKRPVGSQGNAQAPGSGMQGAALGEDEELWVASSQGAVGYNIPGLGREIWA